MTMAGPARSKAVPTDRALQFSDLDRPGRAALQGVMRDQGAVRSRLDARVDQLGRAATNPSNNATTQVKSAKNAGKLSEIAPHVVDKPVTLQGAASRRVSHFVAGIERSAAEGVSSGGGWYFDHHRDIAGMAAQHGVPTDRAITAAAAMSPMNSPDNEKKAVGGLMRQMSGESGPHIDRLIQAGGTKTNIAKAQEHLEGGPDPLNPHSAPKVHSYRGASVNAVPGGAVEEEYRTRVGHAEKVVTGQIHPGQQRMDLFGLRDSHEGILNPRGNTAEDTWMNTISYGQDLATSIGRGGRTNVAKTVGSDKGLALDIPKKDSTGTSVHPSPLVGSSGALHSFNNEATIRAARQAGKALGVTDSQGRSNLPSVAMQEVSWTEARRVAGKDPEYAGDRRRSAASSISGAQLKGQQSLRF